MRIAVAIIFFVFSKTLLGQNSESKLKISHLTDDFYVFTTYNLYQGNRIPANGMYVVTSGGVILVDSPWDTTQFQPLLDSIKLKHNKNVTMCIATHFHEDRTGGLEYYKQKRIKTYTTKKTDELSKKTGKKRAQFLIDKDTALTVGQYKFQVYHPGHGHAPDNIVVWFEKHGVLYGGCLIKSTEDDSLGNLSDASIADYPATIRNVQEKCKSPKYVIPGHSDWSDTKSVEHTLKMAVKLKEKTKAKKK